MPGPVPKSERRRRNQPVIPTTSLPASGRKDVAPEIPVGYSLGAEGLAWWAWAWTTPQASAWSDGNAYVIVRRASLEDDVAALARVDGLDFSELLDVAQMSELRGIIAAVASLATGRVALMREMRELDDRLGLTPKAMASLRWTIVADDGQKAGTKNAAKGAAYGHLRTVG